MFSGISNYISGMGTPLKTLVGVVLWVIAMALIVVPASKAMKDFSDKKFVPGLGNVGACLAVLVIPVVATVLFITLGKKTGDELNNAKGGSLNLLLVMLPAMWMVWRAKMQQKKQLTADKL